MVSKFTPLKVTTGHGDHNLLQILSRDQSLTGLQKNPGEEYKSLSEGKKYSPFSKMVPL